jgi:hypothetical protein
MKLQTKLPVLRRSGEYHEPGCIPFPYNALEETEVMSMNDGMISRGNYRQSFFSAALATAFLNIIDSAKE